MNQVEVCRDISGNRWMDGWMDRLNEQKKNERAVYERLHKRVWCQNHRSRSSNHYQYQHSIVSDQDSLFLARKSKRWTRWMEWMKANTTGATFTHFFSSNSLLKCYDLITINFTEKRWKKKSEREELNKESATRRFWMISKTTTFILRF